MKFTNMKNIITEMKTTGEKKTYHFLLSNSFKITVTAL